VRFLIGEYDDVLRDVPDAIVEERQFLDSELKNLRSELAIAQRELARLWLTRGAHQPSSPIDSQADQS
jgi:hypothetical protein